MARIAFLGPRATFTEQALRTLPMAHGAELVACAGSAAVLAAVRDGTVEAGCVPIENSVEGAVPAVLDGLVAYPPLVIVAEALVAVRFVVLVRPGTSAADVTTVASHPHALAQTRDRLARLLPDAEVRTALSTAAAAAQVAAGELDAAIAAPLAAAEHGLAVLADDVADNPGAVTRFAVLRRPGAPPPPTGHDRTSLALTAQNRPGALVELLVELASRGVDLTRIESRPVKHRAGEYWFHLDCAGHVAEPTVGEALAGLHRRAQQVRFLGSYPRADQRRGNGDGDGAWADAARWLAGLRAGESVV